jgi:DNA-binding LacI/PurR family transcriptional regulator
MIENPQPRYIQAKNKIINRIVYGIYPDGTFLPAENELMKEFNVSRNTIRRALKELENARVILKQQGRPSIIQQQYVDVKTEARTLKIAWLDTVKIGAALPIHFEIFRNIATLAAQKNIQLDYISLPMLSRDALAGLDFSGYAGAITNGISSEPDMIQLMKNTSNLICIDHLSNIPGSNYICTDNRKGGYLATKYLLKQGCKNIIFLGVAPTFFSYTPFGERLQGYQDALWEAGITPEAERIVISCEHSDFRNVGCLLESKIELFKNCDAIFSMTDWIAANTIFALERLGVSVPEDISVIGFDGIVQSQFMHPKLTTVRQPVEKIAKKVLDSILEDYFQFGLSENLIQIEPELLIGETVKNKTEDVS